MKTLPPIPELPLKRTTAGSLGQSITSADDWSKVVNWAEEYSPAWRSAMEEENVTGASRLRLVLRRMLQLEQGEQLAEEAVTATPERYETLTIPNVNPGLLERQRKALQRFIDNPSQIVYAVTQHDLRGLVNMLDTWSDVRYHIDRLDDNWAKKSPGTLEELGSGVYNVKCRPPSAGALPVDRKLRWVAGERRWTSEYPVDIGGLVTLISCIPWWTLTAF